ncbi:MAG TPA: hypothetical protein VJ464_13370 [Blastocatellia bacterium]|nr:hypothetical protein [Blastocatellia bacterium]
MSLKAVPITNFPGFSDKKRFPGAHYYSQGFSPSEFGAALLYSILKRKDSSDISGLGAIKYFAKAGLYNYAQDDNGKIYKEATPGVYDFALARTSGVSSNGAGMIGDQKGRLLYAGNNDLGMYDGTTWTDSWKSGLNLWQHPMDTYEDSVYVANKTSLGLLASDDSWNPSAFTLPSTFTLDAVKSGVNGILMGANFLYQGALILWNTITDRSTTPWKYLKGQILAIERYGANWIVLTQREIWLTDGYYYRRLFGLLDDQFSFNGYETGTISPQRILVVNDTLILLNTTRSSVMSYEFGRMKPGVYMIDIPTGYWNFIPVSTLNTISVDLYAAFADNSSDQRILVGYRDNQLSKSYIGTLSSSGSSVAQFVSGELGEGSTQKIAEAVVLNLDLNSGVIDPATLTFNVSVKIYNFKRQLWGRQLTNATAGAANQIRVDGTSTSYYKAQVGDEVTVLEGANAGQIRHISSIANPGASNETWTLNSALSNVTGSFINLNVQPFKLVEKKAFSSLTEFKTMYFDVKNKIKGKKYLVKVVIDGVSNLQLELKESLFVYNDLGYDSI